jgi:NTE family protein
MSQIGLVLGGGGITGASFQIATLMALEMACDWEASEADLVVGTSGGAYVAALVRSRRLDLDSLVRPGEDRRAVAERIRRQVFVPEPGLSMARWLRHGVIPSLRRPGISAIMGSPARYSPRGIAAWVREQVGDMADGWPPEPTVITAYDLSERGRIAFGSVTAPMVGIAEAVAASSAIPLLFHPYSIGGRAYVDGGVASGTHLDLVLRSSRPLDLIIVIVPMAAETGRNRAWPHERLLDRVGRRSLEQEMAQVAAEWPDTDMLVLCPPPAVLMEMRPNPMAAEAAIPTFVRILSAMKRKLAEHDVWEVLHRHLTAPRTEAVL